MINPQPEQIHPHSVAKGIAPTSPFHRSTALGRHDAVKQPMAGTDGPVRCLAREYPLLPSCRLSERELTMSDDKPSFWTTLPGILTGLAALLTAIAGLFAIHHKHITPHIR